MKNSELEKKIIKLKIIKNKDVTSEKAECFFTRLILSPLIATQ